MARPGRAQSQHWPERGQCVCIWALTVTDSAPQFCKSDALLSHLALQLASLRAEAANILLVAVLLSCAHSCARDHCWSVRMGHAGPALKLRQSAAAMSLSRTLLPAPAAWRPQSCLPPQFHTDQSGLAPGMALTSAAMHSHTSARCDILVLSALEYVQASELLFGQPDALICALLESCEVCV